VHDYPNKLAQTYDGAATFLSQHAAPNYSGAESHNGGIAGGTGSGGSSDSTYQYAVGGASLGNNALGSGDTAPRGVATTAAGTTTWVVDANKNVYVYSTGGTLLGSWSAVGLSSSAKLTGIATNGGSAAPPRGESCTASPI